MKKLLYCLLFICFIFLGSTVFCWRQWQTAQAQAQRTEAQITELTAAAKAAQQESITADPIGSYFAEFGYSGATAGFLAYLENTSYQAEIEHSVTLLKTCVPPEYIPFIDEYVATVNAQAQTIADSLQDRMAQASTAGAWANVELSKTPFYHTAAQCLISCYEQLGHTYEYVFSADDVEQQLHDAEINLDVLRQIKTS